MIIDGWADLPEADRAAIITHLQALASMSPKRRAAILTLTDPGA